MNKNIIKSIFLIGTSALIAGCADTDVDPFSVEKPQTIAEWEYLNDYGSLKSYVDRSANPDFKLGLALSASEFINGDIPYRLAIANVDEVTAGNAMKYASCVGDDGTMDFSTVSNFVDAAKNAGITIYGHTLAWHSQQNNKYLNSLIADKELPPSESDGKCLHIKTSEAKTNVWDWQLYYDTDTPLKAGETYTLSMKVKASTGASIAFWIETPNAGNTHYGLPSISAGTTWSDVSFSFTPNSDCTRMLFSFGQYGGDLYFDDVTLYANGSDENMIKSGDFDEGTMASNWSKPSWHSYSIVVDDMPAEATTIDVDDKKVEFSSYDSFPYYVMGYTPSIVDGCLVSSYPGSWYQYFVLEGATTIAGDDYYVMAKIKGSEAGSLTVSVGDWSAGQVTATMSYGTEWKEVSVSLPAVPSTNTFVVFQPGTQKGDIYIEWVKIYHKVAANTIPQTDEEKKDTLTWAMDNWIKGMMEATGGYVTSWDLANETLSGTDLDGDGYYDLQSATRGTVSESDASSNFYWQDYLGDLDYVRIAAAKARQYFADYGGNAADLKLFVNDYNLESNWDDNKKLKSLIHWIEQWESDGTTKIDGIGTQMHISCYADESTQQSKKDHIVKMFELLAASGKLVKISELDMGYVDASGNNVLTADMTREQHEAMGEMYKFVIGKYFEIIPAAQRYGITQWCATDSPTSSSWRAGQPVGLWDSNYSRKPAYGGFADGLSGK